MLNFAQARRNMVDCQLRTFDVTDRAVLAAMAEMPRERFVPEGREGLAYLDTTSRYTVGGIDRVLLAPMVLARLLQALDVEEGTRLLVVGAGLGYTAAVASALGAAVTALDDAAVIPETGRRLAAVNLAATLKAGALAAGAPDAAPFDAIVVDGAVETRPEGLLRQLGERGRLVCLQREGRAGRALLFVRSGEGASARPLFDAVAPVLPEFRAAAGFVF